MSVISFTGQGINILVSLSVCLPRNLLIDYVYLWMSQEECKLNENNSFKVNDKPEIWTFRGK